MQCNVCDINIGSMASNMTLCVQCEECNATEIFIQILTNLQEIEPNNQGYHVLKDKCGLLDLVIKKYPLSRISSCSFNPKDHHSDHTAIKYLETYVRLEDNDDLRNHLPVKMAAFRNDCLYRTFAMLCGMDVETGSKELRVRNIIDMVINAESYRSGALKSQSSLESDDTWKDFVMELIRENASINGPDAFYTIVLASMSNIINADIRSIYPEVPGHNHDLRNQFHRTFSPFNKKFATTPLSIKNILWSNTKDLCHANNEIWISNCMVPLVLEPDCCRANTVSLPSTITTAQNLPVPDRSFYRLSCHCLISQNGLDACVPAADQQKHREAKERGGNTNPLHFSCLKCSKICHDYFYDLSAVSLFRQNFSGTCLTFILIDVTSSMQSPLSLFKNITQKSLPPRIDQTKWAVKQLLKEIALDAGPSDKAIVAIFDEKLREPAFIPLCKAANIAQETNLNRIDTLELSPRSVKTYFYSVLTRVYEMLAQEPYLYVDLYLFSDGIDTSDKKNETTHQTIIRRLNERIGAKCHFMNFDSTPQGGFVANWLGDPEVNCPLSSGKDDIERQIKAAYQEDHKINRDLPPRNQRADPLNEASSSTNSYMTDREAASLRRPPRRNTTSPNSTEQDFDGNRKTLDDYAISLPSATQHRHFTPSTRNNNSSGRYVIATRTTHIR